MRKNKTLLRCSPSPSRSNRNFLLLQPGKHVSSWILVKSNYPLVLTYLKSCNRYKESLTKSTRGFKEKLLARNATVKELSKGVQREMNAGIAGVARMIERLDLSSKRPGSPTRAEGTSGFPKEGKSVEVSGDVVHNVSPDSSSVISSTVAGRMEIPPCVQVTPSLSIKALCL